MFCSPGGWQSRSMLQRRMKTEAPARPKSSRILDFRPGQAPVGPASPAQRGGWIHPRRPGDLALPRGGDAAILELSRFPQESPPIPKRKPPSQRPERKLDETAQAIARDLE